MNDSIYRIAFIGDSRCGKSSLLNRIMGNPFNPKEQITFSPVNYKKELILNQKTICLDLWDTCGNNSYETMKKIIIRYSNFIFLIYNVTDKKTFNKIKDLYEKMKGVINKASMINIILCL